MCLRLLVLSLALFAPLPALAQPRRVDAARDPLPDGALVRLGTTRWRAGATIIFTAYLPDGRILTANQDFAVQLWDTTGRAVRTIDVSGAETQRVNTGLLSAAVALSGNGKRLAAQGRDGRFRVWDLGDGNDSPIELGSATRAQLAMSHDGARLAVIANQRTLGVCDVKPGAQVRWLQPESAAMNQLSYRVEISRDGKHILQLGLDLVGNLVPFAKRWDVEKGESESLPLPSEFTSSTISRAVPSPDLSLLAGANGTAIVIADLKTGKLAHRFDDAGMDYRTRLAFTPDGRRLVAATSADEMISVFDMPSKKLLTRFGSPTRDGNRINFVTPRLSAAIAVAPDGKTLIAPQDSAILLIDLETGALRNEAEGHAGSIRAASFDETGKYLLTRASDWSVRGWDAETGRPRGRLVVNTTNMSYVNSPDGRWIAVNNRNVPYRVLDAMTGADRFNIGGDGNNAYIAVVLFSPDSRTVAHVSRTAPIVALHDTATGRRRAELRLPDPGPSERDIRIAAGGGGGIVRYFTRRAWFSPDSRLIAVSGPNLLTVWHCDSGQQMCQIQMSDADGPQHVGIAPDGYSMTTQTADGETTVWEIATGRKRFTIANSTVPLSDRFVSRTLYETAGYAVPIAYSPDGRLLALANPDRSVRLWDMARRIEVASLKGHSGQIHCFAFAPDGRRLLSAGADSTALIWDLAPIREKLTPVRGKLTAGDVDAEWAKLLDPRADLAADAIRALASDPHSAVPYLRERIRPVEGPDARRIAKLVADLNSPKYADRERAAKELVSLGEYVTPALREAAQNGASAEVRKQARRLLEALSYVAPTGERLRTLRALEVLEQSATPEAVALLKELAAGGPVTIPTLQARAALGRLGVK